MMTYRHDDVPRGHDCRSSRGAETKVGSPALVDGRALDLISTRPLRIRPNLPTLPRGFDKGGASMRNELTTFGHATLVVTVDGTPRLATDPWLLGSTYWRSWWLERYPTPEEIELVRQSELTYITHSHPDHFHWPSLRMLGPKTTLHPTFPSYGIPHFLRSHGYPAHALKPWQRYRLADGLTMSSVPIPIDDSILLIESATTLVVNLNDGKPPASVLRAIRRSFGAAEREGVPAVQLLAGLRGPRHTPRRTEGGHEVEGRLRAASFCVC